MPVRGCSVNYLHEVSAERKSRLSQAARAPGRRGKRIKDANINSPRARERPALPAAMNY